MEKDLPDEMLLEIFSNLGLRTLTTTCRLVCKRWSTIVALVFPGELVVRGDDYYWTDKHWYHSNEPIDEQSALNNFDLALFDRIPFNLSRLQRLTVRGDLERLDLALLNKFKRLKQLELSLVDLKEQTTLILPALKIFYVLGVCSRSLRIEASALEVLACWFGLDNISLSNPKAVRLLHLAYDHGDLQTLRSYENVHTFITNHPSTLSKSIVESLPSLRHLRLVKEENAKRFSFKITANQIGHFFEQKWALRRNADLQIYFNDTLLAEEQAFHDRQFIVKHSRCFKAGSYLPRNRFGFN